MRFLKPHFLLFPVWVFLLVIFIVCSTYSSRRNHQSLFRQGSYTPYDPQPTDPSYSSLIHNNRRETGLVNTSRNKSGHKFKDWKLPTNNSSKGQLFRGAFAPGNSTLRTTPNKNSTAKVETCPAISWANVTSFTAPSAGAMKLNATLRTPHLNSLANSSMHHRDRNVKRRVIPLSNVSVSIGIQHCSNAL